MRLRLRRVDDPVAEIVPNTQPAFARLRRASAGQAESGFPEAHLTKRVGDRRRLSRRSAGLVGQTGAKADRVGQFLPHVPSLDMAKSAHASPVQERPLDFLVGSIRAYGARMHGTGRRFVYILQSCSDSTKHYVGLADDPDQRLEWHNTGPCGSTVAHRPWSIAVSIEFPTEGQAVKFEKYLKSGSGRAFAKRHFGRP